MKNAKVKNNLDQQIKSLKDNNIPFKYYNPSNNVNIRNYLNDNNLLTYDHNSYLSLNQLLQLVDSLNNTVSNTNSFRNYDYENKQNDIIKKNIDSNKNIYHKKTVETIIDVKDGCLLNNKSLNRQTY
ncbi:conserved protein, unknown function, partial [Hepatocystis sp. ex Piliocolobus tephrosceles]